MKKLYPFHYIRWRNLLPGSVFMMMLCACGNQKISELHQLIHVNTSGKQVLMFIPLDGCGTCIENSSAFINKELLKRDYLKAYVYSDYNKKYLQFDSAV